jgi:hypothetical protein
MRFPEGLTGKDVYLKRVLKRFCEGFVVDYER